MAFETQAAGAVVGIPQFRKDFGFEFPAGSGKYVLPAGWQSAFSGVGERGIFFDLGGLLVTYTHTHGCRSRCMGLLLWGGLGLRRDVPRGGMLGQCAGNLHGRMDASKLCKASHGSSCRRCDWWADGSMLGESGVTVVGSKHARRSPAFDGLGLR